MLGQSSLKQRFALLCPTCGKTGQLSEDEVQEDLHLNQSPLDLSRFARHLLEPLADHGKMSLDVIGTIEEEAFPQAASDLEVVLAMAGKANPIDDPQSKQKLSAHADRPLARLEYFGQFIQRRVRRGADEQRANDTARHPRKTVFVDQLAHVLDELSSFRRCLVHSISLRQKMSAQYTAFGLFSQD